MSAADKSLVERLEALRGKVTDEDLATEGHYWGDSCCNLTSCSHGECGYFHNDADGEMIALLWNAYRAGQLVPAALNEGTGQ